MKDLLLIVIVAFGLLFFFRVFLTPRTEPPPAPVYRLSAAQIQDMRVRARRRSILRWLSLLLVLVGAIVLASALKIFEIGLNLYTLAAVLIAVAIGVFILSFRR